MLWYFRWIANFIFVGMPWFTFSMIMILVNVIFNVWLNSIWADGNLLLVANSAYLVIQTLLSWPLVFEIPFYLNELKFFRTFSVVVSWVYMMFYVFVSADWAYMLWLEPEATYEQYDVVSVLTNMFFAYNIVFNLHIIPVNMMIIWKELMLTFFPPLLAADYDEGLKADDFVDDVKPQSYLDIVTKGKLPDQERAYSYQGH
jgi:hypothetical protein